MAVEVLKGFGGSVNVGTLTYMSVREWRARLETEVATIPASFGESWEQAGIAYGRLSGSLIGRIDTGIAGKPITPPTNNASAWSSFAATIVLYGGTNTNANVCADIIVTGFDMGRAHAGGQEVTLDFRNSGSSVSIGSWA